jgi:GNAT superfamily N-acetyltransferase
MVEMPAPQIEKVHGPARRAIVKGLREYNVATAGKFDHRPLTVTVRERGEIVGGLAGETFWGWMFVSLLWVSDARRGHGYGSALMGAAEKEARIRGVRNVYLDTFSFQAPGFYTKLGYREFARLDEFPAGHRRFWMTKAL